MSHTIRISNEAYTFFQKGAVEGCRSIPKQIEFCAKELRALHLAYHNKWLDIHNARILIERMDNNSNNGEIIIEDIDAYFKSEGTQGYRTLEQN